MIGGIHISSSELVIQKDGLKKNNLASLSKNQLIVAKVMKSLPHGKALLQIGGQVVLVRTNLLLETGEEVQLRVQEKNDDIVLKLIAPVQKTTSHQVSSLVRFFSKNDLLSDLSKLDIPAIKKLMHEMALKSEISDSQFLPKLIEKSGLQFEKKIEQILQQSLSGTGIKSDTKTKLKIALNQDLKGIVLNELTATGREAAVTKTMTSFLETMENFQQLNHQGSETGRHLLPFPVFSESGFRFGQLLIDTGGNKPFDEKKTDKVIQISFLLDMSNLGPLRADFSILKKAITGKFLLADQKTAAYIKSKIPDLRQRLAKIDYELKSIECDTAKIEELEQNCLLESLAKSHDNNVLNIIV
ncbi:MAG: flagellar hook-length control protein FliK [Desulfobacula sp.]|nr:flagellar hook-length control protein FliK [Desulfobacula sp.]